MTRFFKDANGTPLGGFDAVNDVYDEAGAPVAVPISVPPGAIEITREEYEALLTGLPATVPRAVTMRQARLALLQSGKLDAVNAAIAAMTGASGAEAQIAWEFSSMVERQQPLVLSLGVSLGLTAQEIDNLFLLASTL